MNIDSLKNRQLRVFISSTFADMNEERDALTLMFPRIKAICKERGVDFVPIDLRWGITETSAKQGRVLETCMREIDNSRPFFIGILGNRYGWVPSEADLGGFADSLKRQYPWLESALSKGMSITEMEMQYAVLLNPANPETPINAAFFIRDDNVAVKAEHCEKTGSDGERKLLALKEKIRNQNAFNVFTYSTPKKLAEDVFKELSLFLDKEFPKKSAKSYDRTAIEQKLILKSRSKSLFDITRYDKVWLDWYDSPDKRFLNITGDSGSGKSYLLAHIIGKLRNMPGNPNVVYFDCSSSANITTGMEFINAELLYALKGKTRKRSKINKIFSIGVAAIWELIKIYFHGMGSQIRMAFGNQDIAEAKMETMVEKAFTSAIIPLIEPIMEVEKYLEKTPKKPLIVALDNLDYYLDYNDDGENLRGYINILTSLPHIRFIATSSADSSIQEFLKSAYRTTNLNVENLTFEESEDFITNYLAIFGKQLDENGTQRDKIVYSNIGGNPELLAQVLNLMVCFGSFEELDNYISELASVANNQQLYEVLIKNMQQQFSDEETEIAMNTLAALHSSPNGLTEEEIKNIFNPSPLAWAMVRPYVLNFCNIRGKELFLPSSDHIKAIETSIADRLVPTRNKVIRYFEDIRTAPNNISNYLGALRIDKIYDDTKCLKRQTGILMPLYYSAGMMRNLYYWACYIGADMLLTQNDRLKYWKALYNAGYNMREVWYDPHVPPDIRRLGKKYYRETLYSSTGDGLMKYSKKELKEFYERMTYIAGICCQYEDRQWLQLKFIDNSFIEKDNPRLKNLFKAQHLFTNKEYDKLIAHNEENYIDDELQWGIDSLTSIALLKQNDFKNAFKFSERSFNSIRNNIGLDNEKCVEFIAGHGCISFQCGEFKDRDMIIEILEYHKTIEGVERLNTKIYSITRTLSLLYYSKNEFDKALDNAKIWQRSAKETGTVDNEVESYINLIKKQIAARG